MAQNDKIETAKREIEGLSRKLNNFNKTRVKAGSLFDMSKYTGRFDLVPVILGSTPESRKETESKMRNSLIGNNDKSSGGGGGAGVGNPMAPQPIFFTRLLLKRQLQSHFGKVYALDWGPNSYTLASVSADAKMIVWDAIRAQKLNYIPLSCNFVMSLKFEKSANSNIVALGGLDNNCSIYDINDQFSAFPKKELIGHSGYVSCCEFVDSLSILTSSGDKSIRLWDIEKGKTVLQFCGHEQDVSTLDVCPTNQNVFVSGSIDTTLKIWDIRVSTHHVGNLESRKMEPSIPAYTVAHGHRSYDVNCVKFFPDGNSIFSGSEDCTVRWFDMRSLTKINAFRDKKIVATVQSLTTSLSGRLVLVGYSDGLIRVWDTLSHDEPLLTRQSSVAPETGQDSLTLLTRSSTLSSLSSNNMFSPPSISSNSNSNSNNNNSIKYASVPSSSSLNLSDDIMKQMGSGSTRSRTNTSNTLSALMSAGDKYNSPLQTQQNANSRTSNLTQGGEEQSKANVKFHLLGDDGRAHDSNVSGLAMTSFGDALASCSWDSNIKIWV